MDNGRIPAIRKKLPAWVSGAGVFLLALAGGVWIGMALAAQGEGARQGLADGLSAFSTVFLGIFIEAVPYLLLGTLASGAVEVFVEPENLLKLIPHSRLGSALAGSALGLFFPVCGCGVAPLARRLFRKGLPVPMGISFLLAAPVINPIVIASTFAAFGNSPIFWGRLGMTFLVSILVGVLFSLQTDRSQVLLPASEPDFRLDESPLPARLHGRTLPTAGQKTRRIALIAAQEFFEMGRYLVIGGLLAAGMQTLVPQSWLLSVGQGPVLSVLAMMALAVILSVCSTVDAFIALAFAGSFRMGATLAFLVYGPMIDIKSTLMFLKVFRRRTVVYLALLTFMLILAAAVGMNTFLVFS